MQYLYYTRELLNSLVPKASPVLECIGRSSPTDLQVVRLGTRLGLGEQDFCLHQTAGKWEIWDRTAPTRRMSADEFRYSTVPRPPHTRGTHTWRTCSWVLAREKALLRFLEERKSF